MGIFGYNVHVWPAGAHRSWHPRDKEAKGVLRISSTGLWACPHAWLNLTTGNTSCPITSPSGRSSPGPQCFPWLTATQTARGVRPQPSGWHSSRSYPDPATDPSHLSLSGCVCMCQASVYMHVYVHAKCAWVCEDKSLASKAPIRAPLQKAWWHI